VEKLNAMRELSRKPNPRDDIFDKIRLETGKLTKQNIIGEG
jgi:hypothetical protein